MSIVSRGKKFSGPPKLKRQGFHVLPLGQLVAAASLGRVPSMSRLASASHIEPLDQTTIALLRSGVTLPSLVHVLQCLIRVALDSECRSVSCSVDQEAGFVCIDDDGLGLSRQSVDHIAKAQASAPQRVGNAQASDSGHVLNDSQRRVFDSLAYVSVLNICSRTADSSETHQTIFQDGQVLFSGPARTSIRHTRGTTVSVRNLFYNLPVRTGHDRQNSHQVKRQWNECHRTIQYFAICYPHTTFKLRNAPQSSHRFPIDAHSSFQDSGIRISKTDNSITTFGKLFGQALVRNAHVIENLHLESFDVRGFLGEHGHLNKSCQLIFRDNKLIPATSSIHKHLQKAFARSRRLKFAFLNPMIASVSSYAYKLPQKSPSSSKSAGSATQNHPVYLLLFTSSDPDPVSASNLGLYEDHLPPRTEEVLSKICGSLCVRFLSASATTSENVFAHAGAPKSISSSLGAGNADQRHHQPHVTKRPRLDAAKSKPPTPKKHFKPSSSRSKTLCTPSVSYLSRASAPVQTPFSSRHSQKRVSESPPEKLGGDKWTVALSETVGNRDTHVWTDSKTKRTFEIDTLTGFSNPVNRPFGLDGKHCSTDTRSSQSLGRLRLVKSKDRVRETPTWIAGGLADYESPVFGRQLRRTDGEILFEESLHGLSKASQGDNSVCFGPIRASTSVSLDPRARLTQAREAIVYESSQAVDLSVLSGKQSRVVGQADHKFIIVFLLDSQLVLIFDQHAVHERIRVEGFLETLLRPELLTLQTLSSQRSRSRAGEGTSGGVPVLVSGPELRSFKRWQARFRRWGFVYELSEDRAKTDETLGEEEFEQIIVLAVPELLAVRLGRDDGLLVEVLRGCVSFFDEHVDEIEQAWNRKKGPSLEKENAWFGRVSNCPPVLMDLINSKACRGAVMFGDRLEQRECEAMIKQLGSTYLPFQCAHGRPTCVPVLGLGTTDGVGGGQTGGETFWGDDCDEQFVRSGYELDWKVFLDT